ncbi:MAG TPA: hypothetical protein VGD34_12175 [Kribbella sp.]|jgi:hypothetical protein
MASATRQVRLRLLLLTGLCLLLLSAGIAPAYADSPSSGGDVTVAQSLGDRELTVVLRRVTSVPGPLRVDVITHAGTAPGRLTLDLTPVGTSTGSSRLPAAGAPTAHASVDLGATPGTYSATLEVDRPGPWEVAVGDGRRVARIPLVVPVQATSPPERAIYGGFLGAGILLLVSVIVATRARRAAWTMLPVAGLAASLAVAVTGSVLSGSLPLPPQPGSQVDPTIDNVTNPYAVNRPVVGDFSRPPVMLTLTGSPVRAGQPADLGLDLTDGATGVPVDDLLVHDSALIHLLLVGPDGRLWHLHPIRTAPGHYEQHLTLPAPGHYALSAELVRRGGGVQLVRAASGLDVIPGRTAAGVPNPQVPVVLDHGQLNGMTMIDATHVMVSTTAPVAGMPTTVNLRAGDTAELQPWLGMAGHLIVAGPLPAGGDLGTAVQRAPVWSHVHSMGSMPGRDSSMPGMPGMSSPGSGGGGMVGMAPVNGDSAPDETVAGYGPDVPFTYTFPTPGRYRLWLQVERRYAVLTVPVVIDVAAPSDKGMHP